MHGQEVVRSRWNQKDVVAAMKGLMVGIDMRKSNRKVKVNFQWRDCE
jgi:hypothetical protein